MTSKFQSTQFTPEATTNEKTEARSLRVAFAVVGSLIAENWLNVDFQDSEWADDLRTKVQTVAETLAEYQ